MENSQETEFIDTFTSYLNANFSRQYAGRGYQINEHIEIRRLDSLARIFNGNDSQNCTAVCLLGGQLFVASNQDNFKHIKEQIKIIKDWITFKTVPKEEIASKRYNNDLRKFVASITGVGSRKIYRRTKAGNKSKLFDYNEPHVIESLMNIFADTNSNILLIENDNGSHAELCVMEHLINNNIYKLFNNEPIIFGISKLCCSLCACTMFATGFSARRHFRAIHGNFYNKWVMPSFILNNEAIIQRFLGEAAYIIYKSNQSLIHMIPAQLNIKSNRGCSASTLSDSEAESSE